MHSIQPSVHRRFFVFGLILLGLVFSAASVAQGAPQRFSAADRAEIAGFTLNMDVLNRLQAVTSEGRAMHLAKSRLDMSKVHSLDDMATQLVAVDPRIKPLLAKHGFTPHQFLVANLALVGTAMTMRMERDPQMAKRVDKSDLNQANMRFYKAHEAQIVQMLQGGSASDSSHTDQ
jgi:hypothetical protein